MLDRAKRLWLEILEALRPQIRAGIPLVGLEPSCTAAFRDELLNLYPHDEDARRLADQVYTLAEFLTGKAPEALDFRRRLSQTPLHRKAVVHCHCHHKAIMGAKADEELLKQLGLDVNVLDSGCCGMAGSFGFEAGRKYEVSIAAGERVLLPAVRQAEPDTLIIADGFSCREQIAQTTGRRALHLAQVIQMTVSGEWIVNSG
jgi:Fe-S oxidoreductase